MFWLWSDPLCVSRPLGTTFKGKYGSVDYWVQASLERPSCPAQQIKKRFEVMDPVDVNTPELLVSPCSLQNLGTEALGEDQPKPVVSLIRFGLSGIKGGIKEVWIIPETDTGWGMLCTRGEFEAGLQKGRKGGRKGGKDRMGPVFDRSLSPQSPVAAKKEKKVSCMFIPDGRVSVSAQIDRKGFCEGEDCWEQGTGVGEPVRKPPTPLTSGFFPCVGDEICINADFENTCSRIVVPKAAIVAKHTYLANGQTKVFSQKLSCVRGNHIISGTSESWRGKTIRVKKLKPSILGCNILRVEYFLQVSLPLPPPPLGSSSPWGCVPHSPKPRLFLQIYVSVPGSKKIILELPLVIGSRSGIGSRSSSMASQTSSEMSWVDLNLPDAPEGEWSGMCRVGRARSPSETAQLSSAILPFLPAAPPCYLDIVPEDHRLESPTTPLLDDPDGFDSPIFMYAPEFKFMPPPTYTEVSTAAPGQGPGGSGITCPDSSPSSCSQVDPCVSNNNNNTTTTAIIQ